MKHRIIAPLLLIMGIASFNPSMQNDNVLGVATAAEINDYTAVNYQMETITSFEEKEVSEGESIPFEIEYEDDPDSEYGTEEITQEGVNGENTYKYLVTFWNGEEINKKLVDTITTEAKPQIVSKGTKVVWKIHNTPDAGRVWYWYKLRVWATKYDANCIGCTGRTYSGTEVVKGVCATDPKVIKLGTNFYVDGYGNCRAEDIGGGIKGNKIDLGYKDVTKGEWRTGYTDIYLTSNAPDGSSKY